MDKIICTVCKALSLIILELNITFFFKFIPVVYEKILLRARIFYYGVIESVIPPVPLSFRVEFETATAGVNSNSFVPVGKANPAI